MAAPNILGLTTATGKTALTVLTTVTGNIITNTSSSGTLDKINNVILTNYSSSVVNANVMINRSSVAYFIAGSVSIPANSSLVLLGKDTAVYLEEGDVLQANVSANTSVHMTTSYDIMS